MKRVLMRVDAMPSGARGPDDYALNAVDVAGVIDLVRETASRSDIRHDIVDSRSALWCRLQHDVSAGRTDLSRESAFACHPTAIATRSTCRNRKDGRLGIQGQQQLEGPQWEGRREEHGGLWCGLLLGHRGAWRMSLWKGRVISLLCL